MIETRWTEIVMEIRRHCVETQAKRMYEKSVREYFKQLGTDFIGHKKKLEKHIEGLKYFLEHADFPHLRSSHPALSGGKPAHIVLQIPDNPKDMKIVWEGKTIVIQWKSGSRMKD